MWRHDMRTGESVRIGDDVYLHVVEKKGEVMRVFIEAPRSVDITRLSRETAAPIFQTKETAPIRGDGRI